MYVGREEGFVINFYSIKLPELHQLLIPINMQGIKGEERVSTNPLSFLNLSENNLNCMVIHASIAIGITDVTFIMKKLFSYIIILTIMLYNYSYY